MVTRTKDGTHKSKLYLTSLDTTIPKTVSQALAHEGWFKSMQDEYNALVKNNTWTLVLWPKDRKVVGCKWIFWFKLLLDKIVEKLKSRVVAKGYDQVLGFDFSKTFSPVVKFATIRVILTVALAFGWSLRQIDVNNAFLNAFLNDMST